MAEERVFYKVPKGLGTKVCCHNPACEREIKPGELYYMTDDDSWIFCEQCATGREKPKGPRPVLYPEHEREPLHKKVTLRERCQL